MKTIIYFLFLSIMICLQTYRAQSQELNIAYVTLDKKMSDEDKAVFSWLRENAHFEPYVIPIHNNLEQIKDFEVVWIHIPDSQSYRKWEKQLDKLKTFLAFYRYDGKLLFTNYAAYLPHLMGIESLKPEKRKIKIENNWIFDKKGFQSFLGHPIFNELFGGTFIWDAYKDHTLFTIGYYDENFPAQGKVVAVEKSYIRIHPKRRLIIEYKDETGNILSIGGFVFFNRENRLRYRLNKFMENVLLYLSGYLNDGKTTYWKEFENIPKWFSADYDKMAKFPSQSLKNLPKTELLITNEHPNNAFYDLAGRRILIMGKEKGGIDEIWVHPFRILRDFKTGIIKNNSVEWLDNISSTLEIRPESITRMYKTEYGMIKQILFPSLERAGGIIHYQAEVSEPLRLIIKFRSDLRFMWPYAQNALGDIYYGYDKENEMLHIENHNGKFSCLMGADVVSESHLSGQFEDIVWDENKLRGIPTELNQVYHANLFELKAENENRLNFMIAGTNEGKDQVLNDYQYLLRNPKTIYEKLVYHYDNLLKTKLTIDSPNDQFDEFWKWALVGTDRFFVRTPNVGEALVAGYSTTAKGWDGGHEISGRPGYAWYFGRDSEWCCFAIDNYGDFELVKNQLVFLQKYQDLNGKIFHEISTSGVVHYDAADATPLYVILAAHYLRASGDLDFIRKSWKHIKKAMDFLYSTDTNGDFLIENKNVGHGWVEGGKLFGARTTFYLAGLWAQTLQDASFISSHLNKNGLAEQYSNDAAKVKKILNTDFWNPSTKFYHYGKIENNKYNPEKTVSPTVPMYFGLLDKEKVKYMLSDYASNLFSSDWGVHILSPCSPLFNPEGYHYGSVWPLFTGWTALAEYEYGNSIQGFTHILNNMNIKNFWAKGFVEEVMHGLIYKPSGVCPHQCWSETNIIHPAITGMIGWKPNAMKNEVRCEPSYPVHWDSVTVNNLRIGNSIMKQKMIRSDSTTTYHFELMEGEKVQIYFLPKIPLGMNIEKVTVNGNRLKSVSQKQDFRLSESIGFVLADGTEVVFEHEGGIGIVPYIPQPKPGDSSEGYRIVDDYLDGDRYIIEIEGKANSKQYLRLRLFDQSIQSIKGAKLKNINENAATIEVQFPESSDEFVSNKVVIILK